LLSASLAQAQDPLFASDTVLVLKIPLNFRELCRPRETGDCQFAPTTLVYDDVSGRARSLPIEVKVRGGWRSLSRNCSAPLLWIRFDSATTAGTPFEGQYLLPLTTHCGRGFSLWSMRRSSRQSDYEQFLLREFLGQRIYTLLTEFSLRSRLVRISYPDPDRPHRSALHYAFFTEHFDTLAARTGNQRLPRGNFDHEVLDAQASARLALFQYMIGNTDWSIARERNTMLLLTPDGRQLPVPYDLDMSGLVNADYAGPAPGLPIENVRQRYFLGFCQPGTDWEAVFAGFGEKRDAVLALTDRIPGFDGSSKRATLRYLQQFFEILDSPSERRERILDACLPWPPVAKDDTMP